MKRDGILGYHLLTYMIAYQLYIIYLDSYIKYTNDERRNCMNTKIYRPGDIFILEDQDVESASKNGSGYSKHNHIVIGNPENHRIGMVQTMSITSMHDKDIGLEVPIVLTNDLISYVVPYNIHSYKDTHFKAGFYKGCLDDTPFFSAKGFLKFLVDIYLDNIGQPRIKHEDLIKIYNEYCDWFYNVYEGHDEYRDHKVNTKVTTSSRYDDSEDQVVYTEDSNKTTIKIPDSVKQAVAEIETNTDNQVENSSDFDVDNLCVIVEFDKFMKNWTDDQLEFMVLSSWGYDVKTILEHTTKRWTTPSAVYRTSKIAEDEVRVKRLLSKSEYSDVKVINAKLNELYNRITGKNVVVKPNSTMPKQELEVTMEKVSVKKMSDNDLRKLYSVTHFSSTNPFFREYLGTQNLAIINTYIKSLREEVKSRKIELV